MSMYSGPLNVLLGGSARIVKAESQSTTHPGVGFRVSAPEAHVTNDCTAVPGLTETNSLSRWYVRSLFQVRAIFRDARPELLPLRYDY
jgi:hypothetical protein